MNKCFRNPGRKYFIEDLIQECNKSIYNFTGNPDYIKRRQIYDDIIFMESEQGWSVPLERLTERRKVYLRYEDTSFSMNNSPLNLAEENQLKEALLTLFRLKGMPQFIWIEEITTRINAGLDLANQSTKVIEFDQNQYLKGESLLILFIKLLFIKNQSLLNIKVLNKKRLKALSFILIF